MSGRRVALSGSAGTGKTTLGRRLASEWGVPFIEEGMRQRLEAGLDAHALDPAGWQSLIRELWDEQEASEAAATSGFVSDRSSLDYAAFWLHYGLFDERETGPWIGRMEAAATRYDRVLLFPWGVLPLADDGVRSTNKWVQLRYQMTLEGLLKRHLDPRRLARLPAETDLERRLSWACTQLE